MDGRDPYILQFIGSVPVILDKCECPVSYISRLPPSTIAKLLFCVNYMSYTGTAAPHYTEILKHLTSASHKELKNPRSKELLVHLARCELHPRFTNMLGNDGSKTPKTRLASTILLHVDGGFVVVFWLKMEVRLKFRTK